MGRLHDRNKHNELEGRQQTHTYVLSFANNRLLLDLDFGAGLANFFLWQIAGIIANTSSSANSEHAFSQEGFIVNDLVITNAKLTVQKIISQSQIIREVVKKGQIRIGPANDSFDIAAIDFNDYS